MPNFDIPSSAVEWLASGDRGASSHCIFYVMTGLPVGNASTRTYHPADPADFVRCEKLLRQVPEFMRRLDEMRVVSHVWGKLVYRWGDIASLIEEEAPGVLSGERSRGSAPNAYKLMKELGC